MSTSSLTTDNVIAPHVYNFLYTGVLYSIVDSGTILIAARCCFRSLKTSTLDLTYSDLTYSNIAKLGLLSAQMIYGAYIVTTNLITLKHNYDDGTLNKLITFTVPTVQATMILGMVSYEFINDWSTSLPLNLIYSVLSMCFYSGLCGVLNYLDSAVKNYLDSAVKTFFNVKN